MIGCPGTEMQLPAIVASWNPLLPVSTAGYMHLPQVVPQMGACGRNYHEFPITRFQPGLSDLRIRFFADAGSPASFNNGENGSDNIIGGPNGAPPQSGDNGDNNLPGGRMSPSVWRYIRQLAMANDITALQELFAKMKPEDLWAIYSRLYDDIQLSLPFTRDLLSAHERFAIGPNVLDVGAGTGLNSIKYLEQGLEVVAIEPNEDMREYLRQRTTNHPRAAVLGTLFEDAPLGSAQFATVNIRNVIYLVNDPKGFLAKAFKHTRAGGRILVSGPMRNAITTLAEQNKSAQQMLREANDPELIWKDRVVGALSKKLLTNIHAYDISEISQMLSDVGYTRVIYSSDQHFLGAFFFIVAEKPL